VAAPISQPVLLSPYYQLWWLRGTLGDALAEGGGNVLTCEHRRPDAEEEAPAPEARQRREAVGKADPGPSVRSPHCRASADDLVSLMPFLRR
jgi:hypothetical protein